MGRGSRSCAQSSGAWLVPLCLCSFLVATPGYARPLLGERIRSLDGSPASALHGGSAVFSQRGRAQPELAQVQPIVDLLTRSGGHVAFDGTFELPIENGGTFSLKVWETAMAARTVLQRVQDMVRNARSRQLAPADDILPNLRRGLLLSDARAASPIVARWVAPPLSRPAAGIEPPKALASRTLVAAAGK